MGHFVTDEVDRIDLGDGFWVDIKKRMSYGDQQRLVAHYIKMSDLKTPDIDLAGGNIVLLVINIKGWNLVNGDGKEVGITPEAIESLDPDIANKIAGEINDRNQAPKASTLTKKSGSPSK